MHGANATGRPFTGDHAGILLYQTLHEFGFATHAESVSATDSLQLIDCRITNAVKCLPPDNKPIGAEINTCNQFLASELDACRRVLSSSRWVELHIAPLSNRSAGVRRITSLATPLSTMIEGRFTMLDSYHCSRYNTNTRRLTTEMFRGVFARARELLNA